jgi:uncharacterized membrane protein (TIGR02234 family)
VPRASERSSRVSAGDRRQLTAAVLGAAAAGGLALFASGQHWAQVTVDRNPPLPPVSGVLTGSQAVPLVPAMGLLLLAAGVALVAVRGRARVVVGALAVLAGAALAWSALGPLTGRVDVGAAGLPVLGGSLDAARTDVAAGWPVVVLVAGLLAVAVGVLVVLRGRDWPAMGRRYERPGAAGAGPVRRDDAQTDEERTAAAWRALDRGDDPTEEPAATVPDGTP